VIDYNIVLLAVPIGRENAIGLAKIEEAVGVWSTRKIKSSLTELVASGQVQTVNVPGFRRLEVTVYFRLRD
jgi:hypothetical protein